MPFNALSESLSFHKSPQSFISSRVVAIARTDPSQLPSTSSSSRIVRASILNRSVHIISDYDQCHLVLSSAKNDEEENDRPHTCPFQAMPAYTDLMGPFFPPPNLLLSDGPAHSDWKDRWLRQMADVPDELTSLLNPLISSFIAATLRPDRTTELYGAMKTLAWQLLFTTFLTQVVSHPDRPNDKALTEIEELQETLLRGQFSTFPVSVRTPLWSSARTRGIKARVKLQKILKHQFESLRNGETSNASSGTNCPLLARNDITNMDDVANHALLFMSGLANKALASLLLSSIMNIFLFRASGSASSDSSTYSTTLASLLRSLPPNSPDRAKMLTSILLETERLSPPVVGVLRRAVEDCTLHSGSSGEGHTIPKGHEAWLYFPSASRSTADFGDDAELFRWDRFMHSSPKDNNNSPRQESFAFGAGPKTCLGRDVSRKMIELVVKALLDTDLNMEAIPGNGLEPGVQAMLGWCTIEEAGGVQAIARDLKQLPTQRPRRPVLVKVVKR